MAVGSGAGKSVAQPEWVGAHPVRAVVAARHDRHARGNRAVPADPDGRRISFVIVDERLAVAAKAHGDDATFPELGL